MSDLIRFVMINQKNSKWNFELETYTNNILTKIKSALNISDFRFYTNGIKTRRCSIIIDTNEYLVTFTHIFSTKGSQLKIDISGIFSVHPDHNLHNLKIELKDEMMSEWEQCVWLEDRQSEAFSEELYMDIHSVENTLRRVINTILFYKLGGDWWEKYMPTNLTSTYSMRNDQYRKRARSFQDVHTNLMSINTGDLVKILTFKTYKVKELNSFNYSQRELAENYMNSSQRFRYIMSDILNGQKIESHGKELTDILIDEMEVEIDFWKDFFASWFSCDSREFQGKWDSFSEDRNHVAHNKLIDFKLYRKYKKSMDDLLKLIKEAEKEFNDHLNSEMDLYIEELEAMQLINDYEMQFDLRRRVSEEAGVEILVKEQILDLLKEKIIDTFDNIKEDIYYRSDIEVIFVKPHLDKVEKIFTIVHNYFNHKIHVDIEAYIDSSEAGSSSVKLTLYYNDDMEESFNISYTNGSARFDEEQGCYLPFIQEELNISALYNLETAINNLLEDKMLEIEDDEVASFSCQNCQKYAINISDYNGLGIGICLYCEHINHVRKCIECGDVINSPEDDELCDSCKIHCTIA
ncbi:hypothetical protein [Bacillus cereus]|uniref:Apea-like HEPN domain-containing protein n=1 Tax=Bacillus cereus TaxID=1396 RepID=A0A1S9UHQ0_BACCE|nr:hypothetical protein [Bacillus cereus]OOR21730.1 hypothetical protein BW892_22320 [Bacillus cereus]